MYENERYFKWHCPLNLNINNKRASFKDGIIYWKRTKQESVSILGIAALKQILKKVNQKWPRQLNRPNRFCNYVNRFLTSLLWINSTYFHWNLCNVNKCSNHFGTLTPFVEITVTFGIRLPPFDVHYVYLSSFQFLIRVNFHPNTLADYPRLSPNPNNPLAQFPRQSLQNVTQILLTNRYL